MKITGLPPFLPIKHHPLPRLPGYSMEIWIMLDLCMPHVSNCSQWRLVSDDALLSYLVFHSHFRVACNMDSRPCPCIYYIVCTSATQTPSPIWTATIDVLAGEWTHPVPGHGEDALAMHNGRQIIAGQITCGPRRYMLILLAANKKRHIKGCITHSWYIQMI